MVSGCNPLLHVSSTIWIDTRDICVLKVAQAWCVLSFLQSHLLNLFTVRAGFFVWDCWPASVLVWIGILRACMGA